MPGAAIDEPDRSCGVPNTFGHAVRHLWVLATTCYIVPLGCKRHHRVLDRLELCTEARRPFNHRREHGRERRVHHLDRYHRLGRPNPGPIGDRVGNNHRSRALRDRNHEVGAVAVHLGLAVVSQRRCSEGSNGGRTERR